MCTFVSGLLFPKGRKRFFEIVLRRRAIIWCLFLCAFLLARCERR